MRFGTATIWAGAAAVLVAAGPGAFGLSLLAERVSEARAEAALQAAGLSDWAALEADGMRLALTGVAPDRVAALDAVARIAAAAPTSRVVAAVEIAPPLVLPDAGAVPAPASGGVPVIAAAAADPAPEGGAEAAPAATEDEAEAATPPPAPTPDVPFAMVRDGGTLTLAGPAAPATVAAVAEALAALDGGPSLSDGTLPIPTPDVDPALARAAARALAGLDGGKAEFRPGVLRLSATLPDLSTREALGTALRAAAPPGTLVLLDLSTPPPVISPFRFVATLGADGPALLGCDMPSAEARRAMAGTLAAIGGAGLARTCRVGVGAPSAEWPEIAAAGVEALAAIGAGRFELVDLEARLVSAPGAEAERVEEAGKALSAALPEGVSLRVIGPRPRRPRPAGEGGPDHWIAIRRGDGSARLTGAAPDAESARAAAAYARARLEAPLVVSDFAEAQAAPPPAWRRTALAMVDALAPLDAGDARFDGDRARVSGRTTRPLAAVEAAEATATLPLVGVTVATAVTVDLPTLADRLPLPPESCLSRLAETVEAEPILFAPGSADIEAGSAGVLDRLAATLARCAGTVVEIEGHTDSQGRESTNLALSQSRADSVLEALFSRGVSYTMMQAKGYGEARPIADNGTETGRALNRRIAFSSLGGPAASAEATE